MPKNQRIVDFQRSDGHSLFYINTAGSENWGKVTTDNINVLYQLGVGYDVGAGAGTAATFAVNGTVGIGTQTPGAKLDIGLAGTTLGTLRLEGNTSGYVQLQPAAAAGSWTMTLPTSAGTSGYLLKTDGAGVTSWIAPGSISSNPAGADTQVQFNSGGAFGASANYTWTNGTQALTIAGSQTTTNATSGGTGITGIDNTGAGIGVEGSTSSTTATATGVYGLASGASGATYGVYGSDGSATGFGGYFTNTNGGYALVTNAGNVGIGNTAPGSMLDVGKAGTILGTLRLEGNTSGYVQIQTTAAAGSWTMTLPPNAGTSGYVLRTDGTGVTTWVAQSGGGTTLDAIAAATGNQAGIANAAYTIVWNWDTLAGGSALKLASTSTAAASNAQKMLEIALSGANGTTTQTTYDAYFANTHTGTSSTNVGLYATASGGTNNYAAIFAAGNVGIGTTAPTKNLSFTGQSAQTIWMERQTTANTAGNNLTIQASGATSGATDKAGGNLILSSGTTTGTGGNYVSIDAAGVGGASSGTSDNAPAEWMRISPNAVSLATNGHSWGMALMFNGYLVGSSDTYLASQSSFEIWHDPNNNILEFDAAPSGTAGNSISYTAAMKIASTGTVQIGSAGTAMSAMGVCTVASYTPTNSAATKTCTGVPASTAVAVHCSQSAAFSTITDTISARANGTLNQIEVSLSGVNTTAVTLTCMWVKP